MSAATFHSRNQITRPYFGNVPIAGHRLALLRDIDAGRNAFAPRSTDPIRPPISTNRRRNAEVQRVEDARRNFLRYGLHKRRGSYSMSVCSGASAFDAPSLLLTVREISFHPRKRQRFRKPRLCISKVSRSNGPAGGAGGKRILLHCCSSHLRIRKRAWRISFHGSAEIFFSRE